MQAAPEGPASKSSPLQQPLLAVDCLTLSALSCRDAGSRAVCLCSHHLLPGTSECSWLPSLTERFPASRPVPRGSCMPETWRTSLLLLAGITLEQKGSNKHFHSCWLVPHCYSLASHTQPSAAIQSLLEGMEETPQQPSVRL